MHLSLFGSFLICLEYIIYVFFILCRWFISFSPYALTVGYNTGDLLKKGLYSSWPQYTKFQLFRWFIICYIISLKSGTPLMGICGKIHLINRMRTIIHFQSGINSSDASCSKHLFLSTPSAPSPPHPMPLYPHVYTFHQGLPIFPSSPLPFSL